MQKSKLAGTQGPLQYLKAAISHCPQPQEPAGPKVSASQRAARVAASIIPKGHTAFLSSRSERQWTHPHSRNQYRGRHARISSRPFLWHDNDTHFFPDLCLPGGAVGLDQCRQTASNYPPPPRRGSSSLLPITVAKSHPLSALGISKGALIELPPPPAVVSVHVCTRTNTPEVTDALVTCGETLGELLIAETRRRGGRGQVLLPPPGTGLITSLGFPPLVLLLGDRIQPCSSFLSSNSTCYPR